MKINVLLIAGLLALTSAAAHADYTGQTVDGTIAFGPDGAYGGQYYSPSSVVVPGQFFYVDYDNQDTATFTGTTLTINDIVFPGENANGWEQTFSDASMPFTSLSLVSDNFSPDITYGLSNGVITIDWVGVDTGGFDFTAVFDVSGTAATPEPSSLVLLGTGCLAAINQLRRKRSA